MQECKTFALMRMVVVIVFLVFSLSLSGYGVEGQKRGDKKTEKKNERGLARLLEKVFRIDAYNRLVRPTGANGLTRVNTELKIIQIDIVNKSFKS